MGINPVKYYQTIQELAVDITLQQAYVLYIHCPDKIDPEYILGRFEDMHSCLIEMDKNVLNALPEGHEVVEKDGKRLSPVPLPSNVVSIHCIVIPIGLDLEKFPELAGLYGLQKLTNMELLQWLSHSMGNAENIVDVEVLSEDIDDEEMNSHTDEIMDMEASMFNQIFSHYDPFQVQGINEAYDSMRETDFSDGVSGIDFSSLNPSDIIGDSEQPRDFDRD